MTDQDHFDIFGTHKRPAPATRLKVGDFEAELLDGNLAMIRFRGHEVLRAVSFLIRDRDWGTCAPVIEDMRIIESAGHHAVHYTARYIAPDGALLTAKNQIRIESVGRVRFQSSFSTNADFETARAGFTVLHPLKGVVGSPMTVQHGDGTKTRSHWPTMIEPWQPFQNIHQITHLVARDIQAETVFEGDVFEMEDQRNWTDASFKTYVRPLAEPWPYKIRAGQTIRQAVTLTIRTTGFAPVAKVEDDRLPLSLEPTDICLPDIGLGLRPECFEAEKAALEAHGTLGAKLLIAHFDPLGGHGRRALSDYAEIHRRTGLPLTLELALPCRGGPGTELRFFASLCRLTELYPDSLFVVPSVDRQSTPPGSEWPECPPLSEVYIHARSAFPEVRLGGGMMSYFTELNRKPVPSSELDYLGFCTNPIVHAADDRSVMQSFEALGYVMQSLRTHYPDIACRVGPSTIAMRQNPYGETTKPNPDLDRIPMAEVDPRHNGRFGASFAIAYAAVAAEARLEALTLSTLAGPFGVVAGKGEPTAEGQLRPIGEAIRHLAALSGQKLVRVRSGNSARVLGLSDGKTLLVANLGDRPIRLDIDAGLIAAKELATGRNLGVSMPILGPYGSAAITLSDRAA